MESGSPTSDGRTTEPPLRSGEARSEAARESAAHLADNEPVQLAAPRASETPPLLETGPGPLNSAASSCCGQPAVKLRDAQRRPQRAQLYQRGPVRDVEHLKQKAVLKRHRCKLRRSGRTMWRARRARLGRIWSYLLGFWGWEENARRRAAAWRHEEQCRQGRCLAPAPRRKEESCRRRSRCCRPRPACRIRARLWLNVTGCGHQRRDGV